MDGESFEEAVAWHACDVPVERLDGVMAVLEGQQSLDQLAEVGEVAGLDHLPLDDGEAISTWFEPARVDRQVDQPDRRSMPAGNRID